MTSLPSKGFSVLHILPAILIIIAIAAIGVRIYTKSQAAIAPATSCSATFSNVGRTINYRVTYYNKGVTSVTGTSKIGYTTSAPRIVNQVRFTLPAKGSKVFSGKLGTFAAGTAVRGWAQFTTTTTGQNCAGERVFRF